MAPSPRLAALWAVALLVLSLPAGAQVRDLRALSAGACAGRQAPRASDGPSPPFVLGDLLLAKSAEPVLESLGYRFDRAAKRIFAPDGRALDRRDAARFSEAVDLRSVSIDAPLFTGIQLAGWRLDEANCRFVDQAGEPLTQLDLLVIRDGNKRGLEHMALERLLADTRSLDPRAPLPKPIADKLAALSKAGVTLPASVSAVLARTGATVGALQAAAEPAYAESTRFFDGQTSFSALLSAAREAPDPASAPRRKLALASEEQRLGTLLSEQIVATLAVSSEGAELLAGLRDRTGKLVMPQILVRKASQKPDDPQQFGAMLEAESGAITYNHWELVRVVLALLPEEQRDARAKDFADVAPLRRFLAGNPALARRVAEATDVTLFHELAHAVQLRRDRLMGEGVRGNAPSADLLEDEHEAHRLECRYFLAQAAKNPDRLVRDPFEREKCLPMLMRYDGFRDGITAEYLSTYQGAASLLDVKTALAERRRQSEALKQEGWLQRVRQALAGKGYEHGEKAIEERKRAAVAADRRFLSELPGLRARVARAVPEGLRQSRPDLALKVYAWLGEDGQVAAGGERMLQSLNAGVGRQLVSRDSPLTRGERFQLYHLYGGAEQVKTWKEPLQSVVRKDIRDDLEENLKRLSSMSPATRQDWLTSMKGWAALLPAQDPIRRAVEREAEKK